jgi:RNA polymerase sigma-70 factor (ECF subfamily)
MAADPDAALMLAFQGGDADAYTTLVEKHRDAMVTYFFAMSRDRDLAEDLAQELFVKLYRHRRDYEAKAAFKTYMFSLARNLWIDAYRSRRRFASEQSLDALGGEEDGGVADRVASEAESPLDGAARAELADRIREAVQHLPPEMREVFVLGAMQERDYSEVASALEIPVGTVKSRMFHAVRRLRGLLGALRPAAESPRHEA